MITRHLEKDILSKLYKNKAIILMGARQVGKTTLLKALFPNTEELIWFNGDELDVQALFSEISAARLKAIS